MYFSFTQTLQSHDSELRKIDAVVEQRKYTFAILYAPANMVTSITHIKSYRLYFTENFRMYFEADN
jgi:hypothetical protein